MSISSIADTTSYASIYFNTTQQQSTEAKISSGSSQDSVSFSPEAMAMYQQAQEAKQAPSDTDTANDDANDSSLLESGKDEATLAEQAIAGGMKGKGKGSGGGSEDDEDDETTDWYDELLDSMYGTTDETEESIFNTLMGEEEKS